MTCDPRNGLVNLGGCAGLALTRPLATFLANPVPRYLRQDEKPPGDKPPASLIPLGPQAAGWGFRPVSAPLAVFDKPDYGTSAYLTLGAVRAGA